VPIANAPTHTFPAGSPVIVTYGLAVPPTAILVDDDGPRGSSLLVAADGSASTYTDGGAPTDSGVTGWSGGASSWAADVESSGTTPTLTLSEFGFDIPDGADITGVAVSFAMEAQLGDSGHVSSLKLTTDDSDDKGSTDLTIRSATLGTIAQGADDDLWGAALTPAIVNADDFGFELQATGDEGGDEFFILVGSALGATPKTPTITVYYDGTSVTSTVNAPEAWDGPRDGPNADADNQVYVAFPPEGRFTTDTLTASGFSLDVPDDSIIVGLEAIFGLDAFGYETSITLTADDSDDKGGASLDGIQRVGGRADTWGAALTPAIVNADDFGIAVQVRGTGPGEPQFFSGPLGPSHPAPKITVYYMAAPMPPLSGGPLLPDDGAPTVDTIYTTKGNIAVPTGWGGGSPAGNDAVYQRAAEAYNGNLPAFTKLTSPIDAGSFTSFHVESVSTALPPGGGEKLSVLLVDGDYMQSYVISSAVAAGATSISVDDGTTSAGFSVGTKVVLLHKPRLIVRPAAVTIAAP
jgi:hypothetical protein